MKGFACVALHHPKTASNVGGVLRAAFIYQASLVVISGRRYQRHGADTPNATRHLPLIHVDDVFSAIPHDCIPVAVDLIDGACPLPSFQHPERAFYVFGPEDGTLGANIVSRCARRVVIPAPTGFCSNLAVAVNVVLYDRMAKQTR